MFRKQNPPSSSRKTNLSQFGLLDIPGLDDGEEDAMGLSDDDMDLEAELAAISGGGSKKPGGRPQVAKGNLDAMVASSLRDVPSDDEGDVDEDDPDLLSELQELTLEENEAPPPPPRRAPRPAPPPPVGPGAPSSMVSLLQERIQNYNIAEANAKAKGESSRARRFARGLKTLDELLKKAKAGRVINEEDIPPPASTGIKPQEDSQEPAEQNPAPPSAGPVDPHMDAEPSGLPAPLVPTPVSPATPDEPSPTSAGADEGLDPSKQAGVSVILKRQLDFKSAALSAKHAGDKPLALELLKVVKQFDLVLEAYRQGQDMDLSELPTPQSVIDALKAPQKTEEAHQTSDDTPSSPGEQATGLVTATSVEEALRQRLAVFQEQEARAREAGNAPKQRRMGRIVKQYSDAIRLHLAGRPIPVDELPAPPGFAPIPTGSLASPPPARAAPPAPAALDARARQVTRADKQLAFLLQRQKEFKEAALRAKRTGNIAQAKEYLRAAKGFDAVIEAASGGLAVDLKSLPLPPGEKTQLENTFDVVSAEDCTPIEPSASLADTEAVLPRLHQQLTEQLRLCRTTRDHYRAMGNVAETNRFEHLAVSVKQDLDIVELAQRTGSEPPKFHYTTKQFSVVQCNTDLNQNDLELTIVRGIAYNVDNPRDVDTYVKFEFPYPQEAPASDRTHCIKDTNSPEYRSVHVLPLRRAARACQRVFKRHALKLEVYSRGGWFARDQLLGSVGVKLAPLETRCTLHEAFPLMDGRRPAGGSLEVKLRVRTPLLQQEFDNTTHRWLSIDT